jgi:hypothetical protein
VKLWVDDERKAPEGWLWAVNSQIAINLLSGEMGHRISEMSLDHDLGGDDTTRRIVLWMCENEFWPAKIHVHTANPVGREWLEGMIERYKPRGAEYLTISSEVSTLNNTNTFTQGEQNE